MKGVQCYELFGGIALRIHTFFIFSSKFLYFVGKVFDENTGNASTKVNGWQYLRWVSI